MIGETNKIDDNNMYTGTIRAKVGHSATDNKPKNPQSVSCYAKKRIKKGKTYMLMLSKAIK